MEEDKRLPVFERLMVMSSLITFGLLFYRCIFTLSFHYSYFAFNLLLAFMPYIISKQLVKCEELNVKAVLLLSLGLIFFPNCVYLFTDILQIKQTDNFPLWYDIALYAAVAFNGLLPGLMALKKVEVFLKKHLPDSFVKTSILVCLFFSSYSTYLKKFLHLKAWNFPADTKKIYFVSKRNVLNPQDHVQIWISVFALVVLLNVLYEVFKKVSFKKHKAANEINLF